MENLIKMDDLGVPRVPLFLENTHIEGICKFGMISSDPDEASFYKVLMLLTRHHHNPTASRVSLETQKGKTILTENPKGLGRVSYAA